MASYSTGSSLGETFGEAFRVLREHPIIILPSLLPFLWLFIMSLVGVGLATSIATQDYYSSGPSMAGFFAVIGINVVVLFFLAMVSSCATIELVRQAFDESRVRFGEAVGETFRRIGHILLAAILVGVLVTIGSVLLVIPGIILSFLLAFVLQAIMIDEESGVSALGKSISFFRENGWDAFIIVLLSMVIYSILSFLSLIPVVGAIILLVGMPYLTALATVFYLERT